MKKSNKIIGVLILIISLMWVLHTFSKNFIVDPAFQGFLSKKDELLINESLWAMMIRIHIILAIIALMTGPFGVIKRIRMKSLKFHRWNGRIYVLSIVLNYIPGMYVSFFATGGWLSTIGFIILNTLWIATTIIGYFYIKKKQIVPHSQWMVRSFFLSFANMTIYIIVAIAHYAMSLTYGTSYTIAVWLCWILNLLLAELFIRKKVFI
ncbi:DUF2306 domain-containing protein [Aneurinibacillus migulanus]|uniref:Predicted membrane protein n=2 Tax=Aneurinibacillus migulanus TaxID=47500 RepID=A0A0D1YNC1_ANEMI|nr:DUF2306 domain-containing protein [Aneurinibacillus migulanus]KIV60137.1 hypothetical protein TS65_01640 [Aneurinibacillus migulanus]KON96744.1 hypothetical protein AF333_15945 [Aneurinibacillus migulanus]MED0893505.1 DUF2306 domain-containing protein [Aneurinibacillus migulanus]MED1616393.1 DUF2306 domain-containing protein [Aneurinibacillus migulanus]SDJ47050.1 Predicted membrane protein [Aneurinibacillus migulanus]